MGKTKRPLLTTCPRTGRLIGADNSKILRILLPLLGLLSLIWFLIRVIPKPDRINYPCQRVAAPFAVTFLASIVSYLTLLFTVKNSRKYFLKHRFVLAVVFLLAGLTISFSFYQFTLKPVLAEDKAGLSTGIFKPIDAPNTPMGMAKGIFPGRVVWAYDSLATRWDGKNGFFFEPRYNSQDRINNMVDGAICALSGQEKLHKAWDALFVYFNNKKGSGKVGYKKGEKIAIKVNLNTSGGTNKVDATPQMVYSVLRSLRDVVGVEESDITIYDVMRRGISAIYNYNYPHFPRVKYNEWGVLVPGVVKYSSEITDSLAMSIPSCVTEATYIVNLALLKRHAEPTDNYQESSGQTGISCCAKNHFGTIAKPSALHAAIRDWARGMGTYNPLVDLMADDNLGGKTLVYLVDGLYGGSRHSSIPAKFRMQPFNTRWPSSLLASLDVCAIESVALDFLNAEMPLVANADNFLHEASQIGNPPSKTNYLRKDLKSLGVHEHWNNPIEKKYSRNLGKNAGIELYSVKPIKDCPLVDEFYANSRFVYPGDSVLLTWKTSNASNIVLNGAVVSPEGSKFIKPSKTMRYELQASNKTAKTEFDVTVSVYTYHMDYQAEGCSHTASCTTGTEGSGWTGTGWLSILGDQASPGVAQCEIFAPVAGDYDFIITYNGEWPYPATLEIDNVVVSRSIGFEATVSWNWKQCVYPIQLTAGSHEVTLSHGANNRAIHYDKFTLAK